MNRDTKTIRVDEKLYFGFKPKDCEKRNLPIPDALIAEINARAKSGWKGKQRNGSALFIGGSKHYAALSALLGSDPTNHRHVG